MDREELLDRIATWENLHTDFKERLSSSDELAKDIVCFANTDGGQIIVGVSNDGEIVGVDDADDAANFVDNVAVNNCQPPVLVGQETVHIDDKTVLVINVEKGPRRPYRTNRGRYYIRRPSGCFDADQAQLLRLFQASQQLSYDENPVVDAELSDIDLSALESHLREAGREELLEDTDRVLRNWRLYDGNHPTIAGIVLFGRHPQEHLPHAHVVAVRFQGTSSSGESLDRVQIEGQAHEMIHDVARFLRVNLPISHEVEDFNRESHVGLPETALREAVVNAVAHRDYTVQGPVRVFVFDDRVEVRTPGRPPNGVDAEAMRMGVHIPRNPYIYARLYESGLVTGAGTGIPRLSREVREATGREAEVEVTEAEVVIVLPR